MSFRRNWRYLHINDVIIQTQKCCVFYNKLSEENKVPRTLFEVRNVAGSTTYKQSKTE